MELFRVGNKDAVGVIDTDAGVIFGASVITTGREAEGHGIYVDETFGRQVLEAGQASEPKGLPARFDHPNACGRAIGTHLGRWHNFRWNAGKVRADLHLSESAAKSPDGNLKEYTLNLAAEDPDAFATSIVFRAADPMLPDKDDPEFAALEDGDPALLPHCRLDKLSHCDCVDEGAANDGLFGKGIFGRPDYWQEQIERWAAGQEGTTFLEKIFDKYFRGKEERERKRIMEHLEEQVEELTAKNTELQNQVDGFEAAKAAEFDSGVIQGQEDMIARLKARQEKAPDLLSFVVGSLEMSDDEFNEALIAELKKNQAQDPDAEPALSATPSGDDNEGARVDEFETKVAAYMDENPTATRGQAIKYCQANYPDLHAKKYYGG